MDEIAEAEFIAFDETFFDLIGSKPRLEPMFNLGESLREAPVYIPSSKILYISDMGAQKQIQVNLSGDEPTMEYVSLDPPLEAINGAAYSLADDLIYVTVNPNGHAPAGLYAIDPKTLKTWPVINNYVGHHFNSPNDLVILDDALFFTDPPYAQIMGNESTAELRPNVYYYNTTSHIIRAVEEDLQLPNGIALSPDNKILYLADSGALCQPIGQPTVPSKHHSIYAYDIVDGLLHNRRLIYISDLWVPDGVKVSRSGIIYTSAGIFVDVVSPGGVLLGKIRTPGLMQNLQFAGPNYDQLWIVGIGGIYRTKIKDQGIPIEASRFNIQL